MRTRIALIFVLLATIFVAWAQADAGFPGSGKKFPNNASGPPPTQQVWWNCSAGFQVAPCTASSTITQSNRTAINTFVTKLNTAAYTFPSGASTIIVNFYTPITTQAIFNTVYAGYAANAGSGTGNCSAHLCSWDFSAAPTQLLFPASGTDCSSTSASHTFSPSATRSTFATCPASFTWVSGSHLMFAIDAATGTTITITDTVSANTQVIPQQSGTFSNAFYNCWKSGTNVNQAVNSPATSPKNSGYTFCDSGSTINARIFSIQSITAQ